MRDPARIDDMIERLRVLWKKHPDLRLGQLVANLARYHGPQIPAETLAGRTFYIEDDKMNEAILAVLQFGFNG